jgi:putative NADH-flavin reductase
MNYNLILYKLKTEVFKMNIAIIGATGKQGKLLVKEATRRGHHVTAIVRNKKKLSDFNGNIIEKDIFHLTYDDIKDQEVIIDAIGVWTLEEMPLFHTTLDYLSNLLSGKPNRLLVVGGAGSLYIDKEHTIRLMDTPEFPDMFKPVATNMGIAFDKLRRRDDVNWTYFSPAANFDAVGTRTGEYILGEEEVILNKAGNSYISYVDYAIAMIDEAEKGTHIKSRFTAISE